MSTKLTLWASRLIIDPEKPPLINGKLIVSNGMVEDIHEDVEPEGLSYPNCTLLPGLIDCHVHLGLEGSGTDGNDPFHRKEIGPVLALRMARNAGINLRAGVTSVRDVGTRDGLAITLKEGWRKQLFQGSRIYASGRPLGAPEGHCSYMSIYVRNPEDAREAVRSEICAGADVIKIMVTGGILPPSRGTQIEPDTVLAAVEEAHLLGTPVAAHSETAEGARLCVEVGVDSIEHGSFIDDDVLNEMVNRGIYLVPTLRVFKHIADYGKEHNLPEASVARAVQIWENLQKLFMKAIEKRVPLATGTDWRHGTLVDEIELMVQLGCSPGEALVAATKNGARLLGEGGRLGELQPGFLADWLIVEGDPTENISCLRNVRGVGQNGTIIIQ